MRTVEHVPFPVAYPDAMQHRQISIRIADAMQAVDVLPRKIRSERARIATTVRPSDKCLTVQRLTLAASLSMTACKLFKLWLKIGLISKITRERSPEVAVPVNSLPGEARRRSRTPVQQVESCAIDSTLVGTLVYCGAAETPGHSENMILTGTTPYRCHTVTILADFWSCGVVVAHA